MLSFTAEGFTGNTITSTQNSIKIKRRNYTSIAATGNQIYCPGTQAKNRTVSYYN
jgi:hypothetical protein